MNVVVWTASGNLYATAIEHVVEIIPVVRARPQPRTAKCLRGLINYRGRLIPLVDMSVLLGDAPCQDRMSSRIVVVRTDHADTEGSGWKGMLVEELLGSTDIDFADAEAVHPGATTDATRFLGPVALTSRGTIQLAEPSRIQVSGL